MAKHSRTSAMRESHRFRRKMATDKALEMQEENRAVAAKYEKLCRKLAIRNDRRLREFLAEQEVRNQNDSAQTFELYQRNLVENANQKLTPAKKALLECSLNLVGAGLAITASLLTGGMLPAILVLMAGLITMSSFPLKLGIDPKIQGFRRRLIQTTLAGSFMKRSDDVIKGIFMVASLGGALSTLALPFAIVTAFASSMALITAVYHYRRNPTKAGIYSIVGNSLSVAASGAMIGVSVAALIVGAAALANPIGAAVIGSLLVAAAIVKIIPAIQKYVTRKRELKKAKEKAKGKVWYNEIDSRDLKNMAAYRNKRKQSLEISIDTEHPQLVKQPKMIRTVNTEEIAFSSANPVPIRYEVREEGQPSYLVEEEPTAGTKPKISTPVTRETEGVESEPATPESEQPTMRGSAHKTKR